MITLFCDLDNTIVFSHRKSLPVPKRVAEMLDGKEQSYITEKTYNMFSSCESVSIIPVTARTQKQFDRLQIVFRDFNCKYALILNGAVLLKNGLIDKSWLSESKELIKESAFEMERASKVLKRHGAIVKYSDEFLVYAGAPEPQTLVEQIKNEVDLSLVNLFFDSRKVYCSPIKMTKGNAIKRLINVLHPQITIGVGDSINDISMLNSVDIPIAPQPLENFIQNERKIIFPRSTVLSDVVCDVVEQMKNG